MDYGYADNTTYAIRNMVMQKTQISREHGIRLCRKHSLGNTWDGFIILLWYTVTLKLMFFLQLKCASLSYKI